MRITSTQNDLRDDFSESLAGTKLPTQPSPPLPSGPAPNYEAPAPRAEWGAAPPPPPPAPPPASIGELVPRTNLDQVQVKACLEALLAEPYLAVQRRLELANLLVGFEQANHYTLFNRHGHLVGYMAEENKSWSGTLLRQVAKTHRPFRCTIFDPSGNILMTVERPFYFVSTSLFVRDAYQNDLGEVHMNWHLWRRRYSLYQRKEHFSLIDALVEPS